MAWHGGELAGPDHPVAPKMTRRPEETIGMPAQATGMAIKPRLFGRAARSDRNRITLRDWARPRPAKVAGVVWQAGARADPYHGLAADYDWIFDDDALAGGAAINQPATARLLQRIGPGSDVLDAACGTGIDAAVLIRRGFTVRTADGSEAMVEVAAARFRREGLAIPVQRCLWADLPAAIDERFDVVLCTGNALVHAAGRDAMVRALTGLRRMARPGGYVVIDSRNWEKLHAERRIVQVMDRVKVRGGRRCVVLYAWKVPDRLDQEHIAHLVFVFEDGDRIEPHEYRLSFRPFHARGTARTTRARGIAEASTDYGEAVDRYTVIAWQPRA